MGSINQKGAVPLIILTSVIILIGFVSVLNLGPFKDKLLSTISNKPSSQAATPTGIVELSLEPAQIALPLNGTIILDIVMDTKDSSVSAAAVEVNYDPQYLEATQVSPGTMLTTVLSPGAITPGKATITLGASPTAPAKGVGTVATVSFKALSNPVSTQVTFNAANTQIAVIGLSGDQAGLLTPATITIGNPNPSIAPSPSPSLSPSTTPAPGTLIEAESMDLLASSSAVQIFSDSAASGGKALVFFSNTFVSESFSTSAPSTRIVVRARGDNCKGAPAADIRVDNVKITRKAVSVSSSAWTDYIYNFNTQPGPHNITVAYTNDILVTKGNKCDRNLRVDSIILN